MSVCLGPLACCFGSAFCSLCCSACPACKGSTSTRLAYSLILLASLLLSVIMLIPGLETPLERIPALCKKSHPGGRLISTVACSNFVGSLAVYRLSLGVTVFFILMSLLVSSRGPMVTTAVGLFSIQMIKVKSSNDYRAKIHNGFWAFKLLAVTGLVVGAFFIPNDGFDRAWMIVGLVGGFLVSRRCSLAEWLDALSLVYSYSTAPID